MRRVLRLFTSYHSVIVVIVTIGIIDTLLIARLVAPQVLEFLIDFHLFEIVVLTTLVQILILLSSRFWHSNPSLIISELDAQERVRLILTKDNSILKIKVLSAGMTSRGMFLRSLLELHRDLKVEIIASFGEGSQNPDERDRNRLGPDMYHRLLVDLNAQVSQAMTRLKVYRSNNTPSFRCLLLTDSFGARYGFLGWYTYYEGNTKIEGRGNAQIFVDRTTEMGAALLRFAEKQYESSIAEGEAELLYPPA